METYPVSWLVLLALPLCLGILVPADTEDVVELSMQRSPRADPGLESSAENGGNAALELSMLLGTQALSGRSTWRRKGVRGLWQLCTMMTTYTHRVCLLYSDYGCFCGWGGTGSHPLDAADACCQTHDNCYSRAQEYCSIVTPHVVPYNYNCDDQSSTCQCTDDREAHSCKRFVCECDRALASCLVPTTYHPENFYANQSLCH